MRRMHSHTSKIFGIVASVLSVVLPVSLLGQGLAHTYNTKVEYSYTVKKLNNINTPASEFCPVILGNKIVFVSDREYSLLSLGENHWRKKQHLNVYEAGFRSPSDDSVNINPVQAFDARLAQAFHAGPVAFHPDGKVAVITIVATGKKFMKPKSGLDPTWISNEKENKNSVKRPQLYVMVKNGNDWSEPARLPFNNYEYSFGHPCFSSDGKTLYFVSDMKGSQGGKDIFTVSFENDKWGSPVNLGKEVNTAADEMFPFAFHDRLYFSSNGKGTLGGLDIFMSKFANGKFGTPENMGPTINSTYDDFSIVLSSGGKNGFFASSRPGMGKDDIYFFKVIETVTVVSKNISGKVRFSKLDGGAPVGLTVQLVDENGNIVMSSLTDDKGRFLFEKLPADKEYTLKVVSNDPNLVLEILNENGEPVAVLMTDKRGSFAFKKLDPGNVGTLAFMEVSESSLGGKEGTINGQVMHEKLKNDPVDGLHILLVDESGNIYKEAITDKFGNFNFSKLPSDKNYILKSMDGGDDLLILIYNSKDEVVAELKKDMNGEFRFRKLNSDLEGSLKALDANESDIFPKNFTILAGSYVFDLLSTDPRSLSFKVYNESGDLLQSGTTDNKGNFIMAGLPALDKYLFKLDAKDAALNDALKLQMLSRYGDETHFITVNDKAYFVYDRNAKYTDVNNNNTTQNDNLPTVPLIYFAKNSSTLDAASKQVLDKAYDILKKNPDYKLEVHAHADARASDAFNDVLTEKRMISARNYLISKGIDKKRVKGFYHGKKMLLVKCPEDDCTEDQHRQNRRTEFKFVKN